MDGLWQRILPFATEFPVAPYVQAAPDGQWERAQIIDGDPTPILEAMSNGTKRIGVEIMWPGHAFAGTGWPAAQWRLGVTAVARTLAPPTDHP